MKSVGLFSRHMVDVIGSRQISLVFRLAVPIALSFGARPAKAPVRALAGCGRVECRGSL